MRHLLGQLSMPEWHKKAKHKHNNIWKWSVMSIKPFMKTLAERCIPVLKEGRGGCKKHREPSLNVVMCNRPEIVPHNRLMTTGSPRSLRPLVASPVNRQKKVVNLYIDSLIDENSVSDYLIVYTDRSVQRGVKSGCGYTARLHCELINKTLAMSPSQNLLCAWKSRQIFWSWSDIKPPHG